MSSLDKNFHFERAATRILAAGCFAILLAGGAGCRNGVFQARNLPDELAAPVITSAQQVDLSGLARTSTKSELIYAGDVIEVTIVTGLENRFFPNWTLRVSDEGMANVPLIGPVGLAGLELTQAEAAIHRASVERGIYRNPDVNVVLTKRRSNQVSVMGAVKKPGTYELPSNGSDLLAALVAAGGLAEDADTVVEIRHPPSDRSLNARRGGFNSQVAYEEELTDPGQIRSQRVDLNSTFIGDGRDYRVDDGSVVMVMQRPVQTLHVQGLVKRPGQFEMPTEHDLRLLDAIALAGGRETELADRVIVVRQLPNQDQAILIKASIWRAKRNNAENIRLAPGDMVSVEDTPVTFTWRELTRFVRFAFSASTRFTVF